MTKDNGGPAFPHTPNKDGPWRQTETGMEPICFSGMSLRDYFAGMALQGRLSQKQITSPNNGYDRLASDCYELADAMLKARGE
jgi:hypothetical protein